jgi:hypothetical protein
MNLVAWAVQKYGTKKQKRAYQLARLKYQIERTDKRLCELATLYNPSTGHCCPSCASPEYSRLCDKNDRRYAEIKRIYQRKGIIDAKYNPPPRLPTHTRRNGRLEPYPEPTPCLPPVVNPAAAKYIKDRTR